MNRVNTARRTTRKNVNKVLGADSMSLSPTYRSGGSVPLHQPGTLTQPDRPPTRPMTQAAVERRRRRNQRRRQKQRLGGPTIQTVAFKASDPRSRQAILGDTPTGQAYALTALHPEGCREGVRVSPVPDGAGGLVVTSSHHWAAEASQSLFPAPTPPTDPFNWDLIIIEGPTIEYGTIAMIGKVGSFEQKIVGATDNNMDIAWGLWMIAASSTKSGGVAGDTPNKWKLYDSGTHPLLPTGFSWMVNVIVPPTIIGADGWFIPWDVYSRTARIIGKSHTVVMTASDLYNGGRYVGAQFSADTEVLARADSTALMAELARFTNELKLAASTGGDFSAIQAPNAAVTTQQIVGLHATGAQLAELVQGDKHHVDWSAKDGCYVPLRAWRAEHPRQATDPLRVIDVNPAVDTSGAMATGDLVSGPSLVDTCFGWSISYFTNLDPKASMSLHGILHLEMTVDGHSAWSPFAMEAPPRDDRAITAVTELSRSMPHAFIATDNDLGGMIGNIANLVGGLGIPVISDVAKTVGGLAPAVGGLLGGFL